MQVQDEVLTTKDKILSAKHPTLWVFFTSEKYRNKLLLKNESQLMTPFTIKDAKYCKLSNHNMLYRVLGSSTLNHLLVPI